MLSGSRRAGPAFPASDSGLTRPATGSLWKPRFPQGLKETGNARQLLGCVGLPVRHLKLHSLPSKCMPPLPSARPPIPTLRPCGFSLLSFPLQLWISLGPRGQICRPLLGPQKPLPRGRGGHLERPTLVVSLLMGGALPSNPPDPRGARSGASGSRQPPGLSPRLGGEAPERPLPREGVTGTPGTGTLLSK